MYQHPKWPDARNGVNCDSHPELQRLGTRQMKEEPQMQSVYTRYDRRPEPTAMDFSNHPDIVVAGRSMSVMAIYRQLGPESYNGRSATVISKVRAYLSLDWKSAIAYLKRNLPEDGSPALKISEEDSPVLRDLHNGLLVSYIVDEGSSFTYVQNRHLHAQGIDEPTLHKQAIHNLYSVAEQHLKVQPYGPVFAVFMEGNFEASVLLLDTVWDVSFANYVREDFAVAIPARDVLAFRDSCSAEAVRELRGITDRVISSSDDHSLSTSLYRRRNRLWTAFDS
jgi:Protein of unknown function (DUF1444)